MRICPENVYNIHRTHKSALPTHNSQFSLSPEAFTYIFFPPPRRFRINPCTACREYLLLLLPFTAYVFFGTHSRTCDPPRIGYGSGKTLWQRTKDGRTELIPWKAIENDAVSLWVLDDYERLRTRWQSIFAYTIIMFIIIAVRACVCMAYTCSITTIMDISPPSRVGNFSDVVCTPSTPDH
jgi:hypothetical protein